MKHKALFAVVFLMLVASCGGNSAPTLHEKFQRVEIGMTVADVVGIMGLPTQIIHYDCYPDLTYYIWRGDADPAYYVIIQNSTQLLIQKGMRWTEATKDGGGGVIDIPM